MKTNTKIKFLMENGISENTISKMNEKQINVLIERFKKIESSEQVTKTTEPAKEIVKIGPQGGDLPNNPTGKGYKVEKNPDGTVKATPMESEVTEDATIDDTINQDEFGGNKPVNYNNPEDYGTDNSDDPDGSLDGMPTEGVIKEKFESKAQQGLFWARCNKCSSKNCKWCKMAKEFSDSTSKKQYKEMPEKKNPEKTVKKTNEGTQEYWENEILEMLGEGKKKKISKKELESFILRKPKKVTMFSDEAPMELPISKMFSIGKK
jgi:hypothetical protein